jgi:GH24 family phage-related lysozyme (muramidase)
MTFATVRAAAQHIARTGTITPHQLAALTALDQGLSDAQRQAFTEAWRAEGSPAGAVPPADPVMLALPLIKEFEGCRLTAYPDPGTGGDPWTIGYGTTTYPDGTPVRRGTTISQTQANQMLVLRVNADAKHLAKRIPTWASLKPHQQAALLSFTYNVGPNWYGAQGFETITARVMDAQLDRVPEALLLYVNPGSSVEAGLRRRRKAEGHLWRGTQQPALEIQQPAKVRPGSPFSTRLTPHITLGEFALGQEARRFDHQHQVDTAAELAAFMERCRKQFGGKPVIITSGYRPAAINKSVGGASGSEHLYNASGVGAVDFYIQGASIKAVQDWCDKQWPYSLGYGAPKGFVHLGIRAGRPRVRWDY